MTARKKKPEKKLPGNPGAGSSLRNAAEEQLARSPAQDSGLPCRTTDELIHELQVHEIELEMQNEVLREAQLALEESRDKYLDLYEFAPLGYLTLNDKALVTDTNLTGAVILGTERNQLVNARFSRFVAENDADTWHRFFSKTLKQGEKQNCIVTLRRSDGSVFPARLECIRVSSGDGGTITVRLVISDISDFKRMEDVLHQALAEKGVLLAEVHHRVKNNLQIITALLDLTRMRIPDPVTSAILMDLVLKIRTMAQIHTRLYESKQFDKINIGSHIRDQVTDLSSVYLKSGPEITCTIDAEDIALSVDRAIPLALVINEALSNAFKHAFRGRSSGTILVNLWQEAGNIHITIKDDGIGVPEDLDIDRTTSLGMKLIRNLVQQLQGSLTVQSTSPGFRVDIEFPVVPKER